MYSGRQIKSRTDCYNLSYTVILKLTTKFVIIKDKYFSMNVGNYWRNKVLEPDCYLRCIKCQSIFSSFLPPLASGSAGMLGDLTCDKTKQKEGLKGRESVTGICAI